MNPPVLLLHGIWNARAWVGPLAWRLRARGFTVDTFGYSSVFGGPEVAVPQLLELDGVAVGHAAAGPCGLPHAEVQPGDGELKRLYLIKDQQSCGWGSRLFETALAWLEREGPRTLWLGVWSENFGAQRFYARYGFSKVGTYEFPVGSVRCV